MLRSECIVIPKDLAKLHCSISTPSSDSIKVLKFLEMSMDSLFALRHS